MELKLDPETKKAEIIGLTPETIGAVSIDSYNQLIERLEIVESKLVPATYDLMINGANGLKTVLSINNSQIGSTANNYDLASVFRLASIAAGKETAWTSLTANGTSLEQRWIEGISPTSARGLIQKGSLSHLVLQELSNRPLLNPELFNQYADLFIDLTRQYNPNCLIYLFENWAYADSQNWQNDMTSMDSVYKALAARKGVNIIPCGIAWNILRMNPGFANLNPYYDNRHPSLIGIYLNAMICLGKILGVNPINNNFVPPGLTNVDALRLRDIANKSLTQDASNSFKEFTFTAVNLKEGALIKDANFRTTTLEVYAKDINWNTGAQQITYYSQSFKDNISIYPTIELCASLIYQPGNSPIQIVGTPTSPQIINNLDPTKPIYWAINDYSNYANNTGSLTVGYR